MSIRLICKVCEIPRSCIYQEPKKRAKYQVDEELAFRIRSIINQKSEYGLRRIVWKLNRETDVKVNRKKVHRIMKIKGWTMKKRPKGMRPRVKGWKSACDRPNQRWAIDTTHLHTQMDGHCSVTAIIDCCDRQIVGYRVSKSGKSVVAEAALEDALIRRHPDSGLILRSDNGLVFGSKSFSKITRRAGIRQEYITPYTPEQNGMIERWFRTLKEECLWKNNFKTIEKARKAIDRFVLEYNHNRPHRALGMLTPSEWREKYAA